MRTHERCSFRSTGFRRSWLVRERMRNAVTSVLNCTANEPTPKHEYVSLPFAFYRSRTCVVSVKQKWYRMWSTIVFAIRVVITNHNEMFCCNRDFLSVWAFDSNCCHEIHVLKNTREHSIFWRNNVTASSNGHIIKVCSTQANPVGVGATCCNKRNAEHKG